MKESPCFKSRSDAVLIDVVPSDGVADFDGADCERETHISLSDDDDLGCGKVSIRFGVHVFPREFTMSPSGGRPTLTAGAFGAKTKEGSFLSSAQMLQLESGPTRLFAASSIRATRVCGEPIGDGWMNSV